MPLYGLSYRWQEFLIDSVCGEFHRHIEGLSCCMHDYGSSRLSIVTHVGMSVPLKFVCHQFISHAPKKAMGQKCM